MNPAFHAGMLEGPAMQPTNSHPPLNLALLQPGDLVDEKEAAAILCIEVHTLRNWRVLDKGPRFHKIGERMVRYLRTDLAAFITDAANQPKSAA